jgi:hypothetical protein
MLDEVIAVWQTLGQFKIAAFVSRPSKGRNPERGLPVQTKRRKLAVPSTVPSDFMINVSKRSQQ